MDLVAQSRAEPNVSVHSTYQLYRVRNFDAKRAVKFPCEGLGFLAAHAVHEYFGGANGRPKLPFGKRQNLASGLGECQAIAWLVPELPIVYISSNLGFLIRPKVSQRVQVELALIDQRVDVGALRQVFEYGTHRQSLAAAPIAIQVALEALQKGATKSRVGRP